jgi:hypothetical protein
MFEEAPADVPEEAVRWWRDGHHRWFFSKGKLDPPKLENFAEQIGISVRRLYDWRHDERLAPYLGKWPPKREDQPPWEQERRSVADPEDQVLNVVQDEIRTLREVRTAILVDGRPVTKVEFFDAKTHVFVYSSLEFHGLVAAGLSAIVVRDLLTDGHFDHLVRLCHFLATHMWHG